MCVPDSTRPNAATWSLLAEYQRRMSGGNGRLSHAFCIVPHGETLRDGAGAVCEELDVPYLVDAGQVTGQLPIDVGQMVRRR